MHKHRRPLIAGNWKMFKGGPTGLSLARSCADLSRELHHVELVIAPPYTVLAAASAECEGSRVALAGQNVHARNEGAFTGEISASMLADSGCTWVIVGHSERRQHFAETDAQVADKVRAAFDGALTPVVCVGETLEEREAGRTLEVVPAPSGGVRPAAAQAFGRASARCHRLRAHLGHSVRGNRGAARSREVHKAIRTWLHEHEATLAHDTRSSTAAR